MEEINLGDSFLGFIPNMTEKRKVIDQRKAKSLERILNHSKYFQDNEDKLKAVYSKKEHIVRLMFTSDYVDVKQSPIFEVKERLKSSTTGKELQKPLSEYYIKGLVVSSTEFEFGQFLFEKFGKNTENQIALTAIISAARHENDQIKKIIVQKSERIQQENQKRYEEEKVIKAQAALEFEEALQKVGHTSDKKLEEKGKNTDMEKRTTDKMQSVTDEEITKTLDESISGHGYWLVNHRDIIENIIANRIEIAGISQTIQEVGYSWLRSEENPYSDLELDMYEAIAKFNGDVDKEGKMTKKADVYKAINRRIRNQKIRESEKSKIPGQKNERENNLHQFKNYKEVMDKAYPDVLGDDGSFEPDEDGMDVLRYVDEDKLSQIFTESNTLDEFKTNTKQAVKDEEIRREKEWQEQQDQYWQEQFEEQEKTDEIYAKYTVDGDIRNIKPEWFADSKNKEIDSELITKTLEEQTPEQIAAWNAQGGAPALLDAYWAGLDDKQRGELIQYVRYYNEANYNTDVFFDHDTGAIDDLESHNIEFVEEEKFEALGLTDEVKREYQTLWTMLNDSSVDQPYRLANISELELESHFNKLKNQFNNERKKVVERKTEEAEEYKHEIYFYDGTDEPQLIAQVKDDESLLDAPILGDPERRQARNYFLNPTPENLQDANINKFDIPKNEHLDIFTKKYREEHKDMEEKQDLGNKPLQSKDLAQQAIELIKEYKNNPNDVKEYLDFMSKFPELSPRNLALLEKQWPGANMVATYNQWAGKTSDSSKKMAEVLKVNSNDIDVITRTITDKKTGESKTVTLDKLSVRQGEKSKISLLRGQEDRYFEKERDGKVQAHWEKFWSKEEKMKVESGDIQAKSSMKFVPYKVFEISQTNIKPESLPKLMPNRHINFEADPKLIKSMTTGLEIYAKSIGVEVVKTTPGASSRTLGNAKGAATIDGKKITMNHLNTPSENVSTLIHELAHSTLHKGGSANQMSEQYAKQEFEAEMTSYVVSKRYGIDTSSQAIPYIAGWTENMKKFSGTEGEKELSQSLSRVQKASHAMVKKIDAQIKPVLKQTHKLQQQAANRTQKVETLSKKKQPILNIGR